MLAIFKYKEYKNVKKISSMIGLFRIDGLLTVTLGYIYTVNLIINLLSFSAILC